MSSNSSLSYTYNSDSLEGHPMSIHILKMDPAIVDFDIIQHGDSLHLTSETAENTQAWAAINAGFFRIKGGGAASFLQDEGVQVSHDTDESSFISQAALLLDNGKEEISIIKNISGHWKEDSLIRDVLTSGPLLIYEGKQEVIDSIPFNINRHPRSAIGITPENLVYLIAIDGRNEKAAGMSIYELQRFMAELDCEYALNLDGGGSTTLWMNKQGVVNYPSDNGIFDHRGERKVGSVLVIK